MPERFRAGVGLVPPNRKNTAMSLVSTLASSLHAALPESVRDAAPRRSEGLREFDAFMHELDEVEALHAEPLRDDSLHVTRLPWDGPTRDVARRAHHH